MHCLRILAMHEFIFGFNSNIIKTAIQRPTTHADSRHGQCFTIDAVLYVSLQHSNKTCTSIFEKNIYIENLDFLNQQRIKTIFEISIKYLLLNLYLYFLEYHIFSTSSK